MTSETPRIKHIASVTPKSDSRAWQTAVHPRLPMLATCNSDKAVNVYSLVNFAQLSSITGGHKRSIRTVSWKPNVAHESILATGSFDASVGIWRRDDDYGKNSADSIGGGGDMDFTHDADNDQGDEDEEWRFALVLDGHDSEVKSVAWSSGGNLLATCARDKSVWVWEEVGDDDFETIAVLQEHTADVKCVAWHPEEELLASGSYDDDVRLWREDVDDWDCVAVLHGHTSTVWALDFEGLRPSLSSASSSAVTGGGVVQTLTDDQQTWISRRETSGPRLASCSDDRTVRIWRRKPRERRAQNTMSIIRSGSIEEDWLEEATLPAAHALAIYSVAWSRESGRIVTAGADGKIVVYEERWAEGPKGEAEKGATSSLSNDAAAQRQASAEQAATELADRLDGSGNNNSGPSGDPDGAAESKLDNLTSWHVVAELESGHGVFEINHVTWSRRADRGKAYDSEEIIVSTGDDGGVNLWALDV